MGSLSAPFAAFKDATAKVWMQQGWKDKIAAGFTNSGSMSGDKLMSLQQLVVFASQHSMIWVGTGLLPDYSKPTGDVQAINRLGSWLGAMAQSDNVAPDVAPPAGDHETGRLLGVRVTTLTKRFAKTA
jgi:NAD(P)H dehydrogenase (quinone)